MKKLVIFGTGLFSEVAACYFNELSPYKLVAYTCDRDYKNKENINGTPVYEIDKLENYYKKEDVEIFIAIGYTHMNKLREKIYLDLKSKGYKFASFVYPTVKVWSNNMVGENVFIFENNTIQPFVKIGNNTILWSGNHIGHHSIIGENTFISSQVVISGSCSIGNNVFIGVNATIHDGISVGNECLVGAGSIISRNINNKEVYIPSSTKKFPKNSDRVKF